MTHLVELISSFPLSPGVYRFWDKDRQILYVGKARQLRKRVMSYFSRSPANPRIASLVEKISDIDITVTSSEVEALLLEVNLIKSLQPPFNILFRDDKTYPYLLLSRHVYPRLLFYRAKSPPSKDVDCFGPYPSSFSVQNSLKALQKIFRLRSCTDAVFENRKRPCLLHQMNRCSAPCVGLVPLEDYARDVQCAKQFLLGQRTDLIEALEKEMEVCSQSLRFERAALIRDQILSLQKISEVQHVVNDERTDFDMVDGLFSEDSLLFVLGVMSIRSGHVVGHKNYFSSGRFLVEDQRDNLIVRFVLEHYGADRSSLQIVLPPLSHGTAIQEAMLLFNKASKISFSSDVDPGLRDFMHKNLVQALEQRLSYQHTRYYRWKKFAEFMSLPPDQTRVECFDISHTRGEETVGSCVVFDEYEFVKKDYRRYSVYPVVPGDDIDAMYQTAYKHYQSMLKRRCRCPDVIIVDGAVAQMEAVRRALSECGLTLPLVAVSKGPTRKTGQEMLFFSDGRVPMKACLSDPSFLFLAEIRDEAHHYALTKHRARRLKRHFRSSLDDIEGLGPKRQQMLLRRLGSVRMISCASIETLSSVPGISLDLARKIHQKFSSSE